MGEPQVKPSNDGQSGVNGDSIVGTKLEDVISDDDNAEVSNENSEGDVYTKYLANIRKHISDSRKGNKVVSIAVA